MKRSQEAARKARVVAARVVEIVLYRAFDASLTDRASRAAATRFAFRMRREGLVVAPLDWEEYGIAPPSMLDAAALRSPYAVLIPAEEIRGLIVRTLARMRVAAIANAHAPGGGDGSSPR